MRTLSCLGLLVFMSLLMGCREDEHHNPAPTTSVRQLWPQGSAPVPSPDGTQVLFTQEESPAGLYVLQNGSASILNSGGPPARTDYAWSYDGRRIAFSSPSQLGSADAGIWISDSDNLAALHRIWDRGSHPRFYPAPELFLVCAGPDDMSDQEGIWEMDYAGDSRLRLVPSGVDPEVSPNGAKIAYLVTTGGSAGRTMMVYDRVTHLVDTMAVQVLRHAWLSDSRTLVYETIQNGGEEINVVGPGNDIIGVTVGPGTAPAAMTENLGFLFTAIDIDRSAGIYRSAVGQSPVLISPYGTRARYAGGNRAVAQDSTTLIEILF